MKKINSPAILLITGVMLFSLAYPAAFLLPAVINNYDNVKIYSLIIGLIVSIGTILIPLGLLLLCYHPKGTPPTYKLLGLIGSSILMLCGIAKLCFVGTAILQESVSTINTLLTFHQTLNLFYTLGDFILFIALCAYLLFQLKKTPQIGRIKTYILITLLSIAFIACSIYTNSSLITLQLERMLAIAALASLIFLFFLLCAIAFACFIALDQKKLYIHSGKIGSLSLLAFLIGTGIYIFDLLFNSPPSILFRKNYTEDPIVILLLLLGAFGAIALFIALISAILHITSAKKPTSTKTPMDVATNTPHV